MLRLKPTRVVLTHLELVEVLKQPGSIVSSPSGTKSLLPPIQQQKPHRRPREESPASRRRPTHPFANFSVHTDEPTAGHVHDASTESEVLFGSHSSPTSAGSFLGPLLQSLETMSVSGEHPNRGSTEGETPLSHARAASPGPPLVLPGRLLDGPGLSPADELSGPSWELYSDAGSTDRYDDSDDGSYHSLAADAAYHADGEGADSDYASFSDEENLLEHLRSRNLDGTFDSYGPSNVLSRPTSPRRTPLDLPVAASFSPPRFPMAPAPADRLHPRNPFNFDPRQHRGPFELGFIPDLSPEGVRAAMRRQVAAVEDQNTASVPPQTEDVVERNPSPEIGVGERLFPIRIIRRMGERLMQDH